MIELRYALRPDTNTDPPRLQYRLVQPTIDASGSLCPGEWTVWRDVLHVVVDEEDSIPDAQPAPAITPESMGFNAKDCALIAEMLSEKSISYVTMLKAAVRHYQLIHKAHLAGAQFFLVKDGKSWPDTGSLLPPSYSVPSSPPEPSLVTILARVDEAINCFDAAYAEGLHERMCEAEPCESGQLADLVSRRLLYAVPLLNEAAEALRSKVTK